MMTLASFQRAFWHDLWAPDGVAVSPWAQQPGFAVYRNTVLKSCVENLLALYPSVHRLTGDDWLSSVALAFARTHPPRDACMAHYGKGFPAFVAQVLPAGELPWLVEVAQLDALWNECHVAADAPLLLPSALSALDARVLARATLKPHPAARWRGCAAWPAFSLWQAAREAWPDPNPLHWQGQGALLTRPHGTVHPEEIGLGACALLDACARSQPITEAVACALATEPDLDLGATLGQLLSRGAFTGITT